MSSGNNEPLVVTMSTEIFVDGICKLDDKVIHSYFSRFGTRITNYESHRQRSTNSCCFAWITLTSHHTVNAILRHRPHTINSYPLFVKRLLPASVCSFSERLLPVSSLFVYNRVTKELDEEKLTKYFQTFGPIVRVERDSNHQRLLIEFSDYDSVDRIFLCKDQLPKHVEIHKNIMPRAQNTIEYHGTCRQKERDVPAEKKVKKRHSKTISQFDERYQDLLQKTIENLVTCKAQLRSTENEYAILQMEYATIKQKYDQLNQHLQEQNRAAQRCPLCEEHETLSTLGQPLSSPPTKLSKPEPHSSPPHQQYILSRRLNNDVYVKQEGSDNSLTQSRLLTSGLHDTVPQQMHSPSSIHRLDKPPTRIIYKYESVQHDEQ